MRIVGIDESGRGCVAGSMFLVGLLPLDKKFYELDLKDSKKLKKEKREELAFNIKFHSKLKIIRIGNESIDKYGFSYCYNKGLTQIIDFFETYALTHNINDLSFYFDGNTNYGVKSIKTVIKGDNKYKEIMGASIIAKYLKDKEMEKLSHIFPQYGFEKNSGYLTKEHKLAIKEYGLSDVHRKSFKIRL